MTREIKTVGDSLAVSLDERGRLDLEHIAASCSNRSNASRSTGDLVYENPSGTWELADEYLSGDVVTKLEEAEAAAKTDERYLRNVKALVAVQPKPLGAKDITVKLGANWVPAEYISDFAAEVLGTPMTVEYKDSINRWEVSIGSAAEEETYHYRRRRRSPGSKPCAETHPTGAPPTGDPTSCWRRPEPSQCHRVTTPHE